MQAFESLLPPCLNRKPDHLISRKIVNGKFANYDFIDDYPPVRQPVVDNGNFYAIEAVTSSVSFNNLRAGEARLATPHDRVHSQNMT